MYYVQIKFILKIKSCAEMPKIEKLCILNFVSWINNCYFQTIINY